MVKRAALFAIGLGAAVLPAVPAAAGTYFDPVCNCGRPDSQFNSRVVVHEKPRVIYRTRVVNTTRVVPRVRVVTHNRVVTHVHYKKRKVVAPTPAEQDIGEVLRSK